MIQSVRELAEDVNDTAGPVVTNFYEWGPWGEIAMCIPLFDPEARLEVLKRRVADYPEALRQAVVQDYLFMAEFTLTVFARKVAARSDT